METLPTLAIEDSYFICNLEPSLALSVDPRFDAYQWRFENGTLVSSTWDIELIDAGRYTLDIIRVSNGISCEITYDFELIRSVPPSITKIKYEELTNNNFIEIIVFGDGDFEYSIDGGSYQQSNRFENLRGGIYTVYVRDRHGCGEDSKEVTIIDYPKFFTPNSDGFNDTWHISGIENYPAASISVYDRYGKLLTQLNAKSTVWDGVYNGEMLPSSDDWFMADLGDGRQFSGHFTLKR